MSNTLYRLVYVSQNEINADKDTIQREIHSILHAARDRNKTSDVTGALMFNQGSFAQILEGQHDHIQETFERIQCDSRHSHVVVLSFEPVSQRQFPNWSMAYLGENSGAVRDFEKISLKSGYDPDRLSGDEIFDLLAKHLVKEERYSQLQR